MPRASVSRLSLVLGACGLVFILGTSGFFALHERDILFREARDKAQSTAFALSDHAARLFEVADLALRTTVLALGTSDWDTAASSRSLWAEMRATAQALPYLGDLWLNDATGRLRASSVAFPTPPSEAADRPAFVAARDGDPGLIIADPLLGRVTAAPTFLIARRLQDETGRFKGMVSATADLDYFRSYWRRLDLPDGEEVAIVRPVNGRVLVRSTDGPNLQVQEDAALRAAVARSPEAGRYAPAPSRTGYYHQVADLPLYVAVSFRDDMVERDWRGWLSNFVLFPVSAVVALAAIMAVARRQSRAEALAGRELFRARTELATTNQRLEQRVAERTAALKESSAEIQRFAYIVSHDLRAPLVNIMGFTSELQRLRADLFPDGAMEAGASPATEALREDFDEAIGFIRSSIGKMDRLINAILLLSRQGSRVFDPQPVDMEALMRSIADGVAHRVQASGSSVTIGPLPRLVIDQIAAEQVFSNLVDNAVKYLRPGVPGEIVVTAETGGSHAVFHVADNGRGIAGVDHARIFELFRRSGPQNQPGDGIGLAHVKTLVRQLGGTIAVESTLGQGSRFSVTLPLAPEGATP